MKKSYLLILIIIIITFPSFGQDENSPKTGHIAVAIIPKGADMEQAKKLLEAIGESMKSAEGCLAVYTSNSGIGSPLEDPGYLMMQTVLWKSDTDLFKWAQSDKNKSGSDWAPLIMKTKVKMFGYNVDASLN